ncbi:MAG: helix-turn-helix domain-containing protein [Paracoccaceae bacterium]
MMEKIEHPLLSHIPMRSLSLRLARSTIKMQHNRRWKIDKINPVHDLVICLSGQGLYRFDDTHEEVELTEGMAMLIPAYTRFRGALGGGEEALTGIAQHFSLELFGRGDLIQNTTLKRSAALPNWETLGPIVRLYRETANFGSTTLSQHHQFMVLLLAYFEAAFLGWQTPDEKTESQDHLSVQIMMTASRLSSDPLGAGVEELLAEIPYNQDYFRRAFKQRIGLTPQKFREMKRMEFAASRLGMGVRVKTVAAELGYSDPYYFSRQFKGYLGSSPSTYLGRNTDDPS